MNDSHKPGVPAAPIAPGNFDRAWNDPPLFSYNESSNQQAQTTGLKLNKRVGFPTTLPPPPQGGESSGPPRLHDAGCKPLTSSILPPPPPGAALLPPPSLGPGSLPPPPACGQVEKMDDSPEIDKTAICDKLKELATVYCSSKSADICKRIGLMEKSWGSPSFSPRIGQILADFCSSLESKNLAEADRRLTTLGADYAGECAGWIIGLRHILTSAKEQNPVEAPSESQNPTPYFVPQPADDA